MTAALGDFMQALAGELPPDAGAVVGRWRPGEQFLLIGGGLTPAASGNVFENVNPATETVLGGAPDGKPPTWTGRSARRGAHLTRPAGPVIPASGLTAWTSCAAGFSPPPTSCEQPWSPSSRGVEEFLETKTLCVPAGS